MAGSSGKGRVSRDGVKATRNGCRGGCQGDKEWLQGGCQGDKEWLQGRVSRRQGMVAGEGVKATRNGCRGGCQGMVLRYQGIHVLTKDCIAGDGASNILWSVSYASSGW